jgi:hypothetical protein
MVMPRPRKHLTFDASDQVIADFFDQAMALKDSQRGVSSEITALNSLMQDGGVDPGTLSLCWRLARMKPGKRGVAVALLHRYLVVLASRMADPTVAVPAAPAEVAPPTPFGSATRAA